MWMETKETLDRRTVLKTMAMTTGGLLLPTSLLAAKRTRIRDLRMWTAPDHTRIVFDLDRRITYRVFSLRKPDRLVLDIQNSTLAVSKSKLKGSDEVVKSIRVGYPKTGTTRIVFQLRMPHSKIQPRDFLLEATSRKGPRLVVDLFRKSLMDNETGFPIRKPQRRKETVIVIDAGHGGEDPGAVGKMGTKEKNVALAVAKKLQRRFKSTPGFKAHLTRKGDYYVSLRRRVSLARRHNPDLFISLHADSFKDKRARGASVYCLSERGKPSPNRAIAALVRRENNADLIGGVNLTQVLDPEVAGILMDLSQRDSINRALAYGEDVIGSLKRVSHLRLHFKRVKQAGFAVLKAPDMPSVLVEMAFLSNPKEEKQLRQKSYQNRLADALFKGTREYVSRTYRGV
ncbi:MAG: N-acetylmuramoyl-L-alanine amidase [Magnetococcales bacterium]|nr:N-acetylmuramoyl-L-alanine amidase [Magnetococcales bacterium]